MPCHKILLSSPASNPRFARFLLTPLVRGSIGQAKASNRFGGFRCGGFCGEKAGVIAGKTRNNEPDYGMTDAAHDFSFSGPCSYGKTPQSQSGR
jgi:hypothetical protein